MYYVLSIIMIHLQSKKIRWSYDCIFLIRLVKYSLKRVLFVLIEYIT